MEWKRPVTVKCGNGQLSCFVPLDSSQDTVTSGVQTVIIFLMAQAASQGVNKMNGEREAECVFSLVSSISQVVTSIFTTLILH